MNLILTDAVEISPPRETAFHRFALRVINDPRDVPFLRLILVLSAVVLPFAAYLFVPGCFRWYLAAPYVAIVLWFVGPFILMLHNTSHRRLFKRGLSWLNAYIPWVLGPFFGESPETYFAHHVGMHHPENNLAGDLSSTMTYQRDSKRAFARYLGRFLLIGIFELARYFVVHRRPNLARRAVIGELAMFGLIIGLSFVEWRATLVVFIVPLAFTRLMMMCGNWGQHAFIDASSPENNYRNSITCINTPYNRRCFNDGYHIGHHVKQTRHWTEMPQDFLANRATYLAEGAIVFQGIDFFGVWFLLMSKRYAALARRVVTLDGTTPNHAEIEALLRSRTRPIL